MGNEKRIYARWRRRWRGAERDEGLTLLGKKIFVHKRRAVLSCIRALEIRTVIEVGCGTGHILEIYAGEGLGCLGIDISREAVAACRKKGLPALLQDVADVTTMYDLVSSDGMLEHFINFIPYARHMMRISRRYVLLLQPNRESFTGKTLAYLAELVRGDVNVFEYNYRIDDFISVFSDNGFAVVYNTPVFHDMFRLLLFEKK